jgi:hypothetical protein
MVDFGFGGSLSLFDEFKSKDSDLCRANRFALQDDSAWFDMFDMFDLLRLNMVQSCSFSCSIFGHLASRPDSPGRR